MSTSTRVSSQAPPRQESPRPRQAAAAGAIAAALALAAAELAAGLLRAAASPLELVGNAVIDIVPPTVEDAAIALFGTADKVALQIGTVVIALALGAALGLLARSSWPLAIAGFSAVGLIGVFAIRSDPQASTVLGTIATAVGVTAGLVTLRRLLMLLHSPPTVGGSPSNSPPTVGVPASDDRSGVSDRRGFLRTAVAAGLFAVVGGGAGRWLLGGSRVDEAREQLLLPEPASPLPPPPEGAALAVDGVSTLFTPNETFYRIDTALRIPSTELDTWRLVIDGLVERPIELSYDQLVERAVSEADMTIACVSNEVGGQLIGNARWQGVPLRELLEEAGIDPRAEQVVGRSLDGFTAGFPVAAVLDGRQALVAIGMNGEPLPAKHGFPARLVVAGLYGYVSATKWLEQIELTTMDFDAYWVPRGWAKEAPIKLQSRIDVPRSGAGVQAGRVAVAGVAWAPTRGISGVEVRVDDGPWQPARLAAAVNDDTWRQWVFDWDAQAGDHQLTVRATDGDGQVQTERTAPPRPDGATGHHAISVSVG